MTLNTRWLSRTRFVMVGAAAAALALFAWLIVPARSTSAAPRHLESSGAVAVDAAAVTRRDVPVYLDGLGTVQAFYTVKVTARVDGELTKVAFTEGQAVKRGDLLAVIDPRPYQAAFDQARANLAKDQAQLVNARKDLDRYTVLAPKKLASAQQLDTQHALVEQTQAQIEGDRAAMEAAQTQLSYTRITSPINGRTGIRLVDPGNIVHAADTTGIVVITQLQPIAAIITLPETSLGAIAEAMSNSAVSVAVVPRDGAQAASSEGASADPEHGTVQLIDNQIDQTTGTVRLKATFANARQRLWPGEYINARVLVRTVRHALTVPAASLQRGPDGLFAYVIGPDLKVEPRPVQVGYSDENVAVIESGLNEGDRVATSNFYRLQPGALVQINRTTQTQPPEQAAGPERSSSRRPT